MDPQIDTVIRDIEDENFGHVDIIDFIADDMSKDIIDEKELIKATTINYLSSMMPHPINNNVAGATTTGKTKTILGVSKYFPLERFIIYETVSPQALRYGADRWFDKDNDEDVTHILHKLESELEFAKSDEKAEIKKKINNFKEDYFKCNDFENKCLIFLEDPGLGVLKQLRSLLEHDSHYLTSISVHESKQIELNTRGWPAFMYLTADGSNEHDDEDIKAQVESRIDSLFPTTSMDKLHEILDLKKTKAFTPVNLKNFIEDFNSQKKIQETFEFILKEVEHHKNVWTEKGVPREKIDLVLNPFHGDINKMFPAESTTEARISERMIRVMQTITLSRLYKRPYYENDGLRQYLTTKQDYETIRELIEHFKFSGKHLSAERMFVERVLIPVFNTQKVKDEKDKSQTTLENVDKRPRAIKKDIISKAGDENFVRNTTLTRLKKLESDGILEVKKGAGGGYYLNYSTNELLEQIENKEQIPEHPKQHTKCIKDFIETNINNGSGTLYIDNKPHNSLEGANLDNFISRYYQFL
jgi:hypothetical protein